MVTRWSVQRLNIFFFGFINKSIVIIDFENPKTLSKIIILSCIVHVIHQCNIAATPNFGLMFCAGWASRGVLYLRGLWLNASLYLFPFFDLPCDGLNGHNAVCQNAWSHYDLPVDVASMGDCGFPILTELFMSYHETTYLQNNPLDFSRVFYHGNMDNCIMLLVSESHLKFFFG